MRAVLVLLFAVGVSSKTLGAVDESDPHVSPSQVNETEVDVAIYQALYEDMSSMVQKDYQESKIVMSDQPSRMQEKSARVFCHLSLTSSYKDCRTRCSVLPASEARTSCRNNNWLNYWNKCFGGYHDLDCPPSVTMITTTPRPPGPTSSNNGQGLPRINLNTLYGEITHFYTTNVMTRSDAKKYCEDNGGLLAEPADDDMLSIINELTGQINYIDSITSGYWLGGRRIDGTFRWENQGLVITDNPNWFSNVGITCPTTNCPGDCTYLTFETSDPVDLPMHVRDCSSKLRPLCRERYN